MEPHAVVEDFDVFEDGEAGMLTRGEKVERLGVRGFLPGFEGDDCAEIYRVERAEVAQGERAQLSDCGLGFRDLAALAGGEIGEFQAAGVVFVLGFVLLVGRAGSGDAGGVEAEREFGVEPGDDGFEERGLFHDGRMAGAGWAIIVIQ